MLPGFEVRAQPPSYASIVLVDRIIHIRTNDESAPNDGDSFTINIKGTIAETTGAAEPFQGQTRHDIIVVLAREGFSSASIERILTELREKGSVLANVPPRIGPRIVRAWFDTALNPMIESIERELALLEMKNWTYSFGARTLELVQPLKRRLQNANLQQILHMNGSLSATLENHDASVEALTTAVKMLHAGLVTSSNFVEICDSLLTEKNLNELDIHEPREIFGAYPPADRYNLIAQYVVNHAGELPHHYSTAKFWNRNRGILLGCLNEITNVQDLHEAAIRAAQQLIDVSKALEKHLNRFRQQLSLQFDVPIIPSHRKKLTA